MNDLTLTIAGGLAYGFLVGGVHATLLYRAVMTLAAPGRSPALVALHAVRFAFVVAAFWLAARQGASALIAAVAGFTLAQFAARQLVRRP